MATQKRAPKLPLRPDPVTVDFPTFFEFYFMPGMGIDIPILDIHRKACRHLQDAYLGDNKNVEGDPIQFYVMNMPPRIGKTVMILAFIAWGFTINPKSKWIYASYTQTVADSKCLDLQRYMESDWYQRNFNVRFGAVRRADQFRTSEGGEVRAAGNDASITGFGAGHKMKLHNGCFIFDDPANPNQAASPVETAKLIKWFGDTALSRRESPLTTPMIIVQQRLAVNDLSGYICKTYKDVCLHITFPALVKDDKDQWVSTIKESQPVKDLLRMKENQPLVFNAQYQQEPILEGGNMIPVNRIQYYDERPEDIEKMDYEAKFITTDTAMMTKQSNDYSVLMCWVKMGSKAYLIDMLRGRWESPQLTALMAEFYKKHTENGKPVRRIIIEEALCGLNYLQSLVQAGLPAEGIKRTKDKSARVSDILVYVFNGQVFLPRAYDPVKGTGSHFTKDLLDELLVFKKDGNNDFDDQVDAFSDGVSACLAMPLTTFDTMGRMKDPRFGRATGKGSFLSYNV